MRRRRIGRRSREDEEEEECIVPPHREQAKIPRHVPDCPGLDSVSLALGPKASLRISPQSLHLSRQERSKGHHCRWTDLSERVWLLHSLRRAGRSQSALALAATL